MVFIRSSVCPILYVAILKSLSCISVKFLSPEHITNKVSGFCRMYIVLIIFFFWNSGIWGYDIWSDFGVLFLLCGCSFLWLLLPNLDPSTLWWYNVLDSYPSVVVVGFLLESHSEFPWGFHKGISWFGRHGWRVQQEELRIIWTWVCTKSQRERSRLGGGAEVGRK